MPHQPGGRPAGRARRRAGGPSRSAREKGDGRRASGRSTRSATFHAGFDARPSAVPEPGSKNSIAVPVPDRSTLDTRAVGRGPAAAPPHVADAHGAPHTDDPSRRRGRFPASGGRRAVPDRHDARPGRPSLPAAGPGPGILTALASKNYGVELRDILPANGVFPITNDPDAPRCPSPTTGWTSRPRPLSDPVPFPRGPGGRPGWSGPGASGAGPRRVRAVTLRGSTCPTGRAAVP